MEASPVLMMAAPQPPRAGEEGTAETSSSPPCRREFHEVLMRIEERLRRTAALAGDPASFRRRLAHHLERLPESYLADIDAGDRAEDVLLHCRILDKAADPDKRPVFHARYLKSITVGANDSCIDEELGKACQRSMQGLSLETEAVDATESTGSWHRVLHLHEIIFCALDKRKLLCELSTLFDGFGLHIREGHLYCRVDGLCLAIFVVQGWNTEEIDELIDGIRKKSKEPIR